MVVPAHAPGPPPASRGLLRHPARFVTALFAGAVAVGTIVLFLPIARAGPGGASLGEAAFTATSALTVTGLAVVDTAAHWSTFGEVVILVLIQLGGLGIMTLASLLLLGFSRRLGLRHRLAAQVETGVLTLGEVRAVVGQVAVLSLVVEVVTAIVLFARFALTYDESVPRAAWLAVFHAVSAFNNAGFALFDDGLVRFVTDPVVNLAVISAVVVGGLGVPVLAELLRDRLRWARWSLHTKLTVVTSAVLIVVPWLLICAFEWSNDATLGGLDAPGKTLAGLFQSAIPRSAGFNTIAVDGLRETTSLLVSGLMFVGSAPASTGGGIKVTTLAMLTLVIVSEIRGDRDVNVFDRRTPAVAQRQALSIALLGIGVVLAATLALLAMADRDVGAVVFEATSAFGTSGMSRGLTPELPPEGRAVLGLLMFAGRVGPLTVGAALALRSRDNRFRYPEERPLIG